jgi:Increased loss of mitochondrial DNA protein 1
VAILELYIPFSLTVKNPHNIDATKAMAVVNANTIIRSLSLFHITLGFFFLTSPATIADQTLVFVLGEAMGLVRFLPFSL